MTNITEHKWSDDSVMDAQPYTESINIGLHMGCGSIDINKSDAIAIAKHFGLIKDKPKDQVRTFSKDALMEIHKEQVNEIVPPSVAFQDMADEANKYFNKMKK